MAEPKIRLTGYITVPQDRIGAITDALKTHARLSRASEGCESFSVTANARHAGRFDVAEVFSNRAAFERHQKRAQASDWGKISQGIARSYRIEEID